MRFKKLDDRAVPPTKAHNEDAGFDLASLDGVVLPPGVITTVNTGISVSIPAGHVGLLVARSSLQKKSLMLANSMGIIDSGYLGPIIAKVYNFGEHTQGLAAGERFVQLLVVPIAIDQNMYEDLGSVEAWESQSIRGTGGFGSTGAV